MSTSTNFMESKTALNFEDSSTFHDRVLIVGEKKFYVVSGTLSMWSEYFRGLFSGNFNESDKKEIELKELDTNIFEIFLRSIYGHSLPVLTVDDIIPLIELSYRFLAPVVFEQCNEFIDKNMDKMDDIMLKLLDTACIYGNEELKTTLTNYFKDAEMLTKFKCNYILELAIEHNLDDLKNLVALFMKDHVTVDSISDYLDCCEKFDLLELKTNISTVIGNWQWNTIPESHNIKLAKSAFKHDMDILKHKIRRNIHCMAEEKHKSCRLRAKDGAEVTSGFSVNWFIRDFQQEIIALPNEISQFILFSACKTDM